jgi:hypothetical protein
MSEELQLTSSEIVNFAMLEDEDIEQAQFIFNAIQVYVNRNLKYEVDYGKIPGCGEKNILFKPGAEKLLKLFKLKPKFEIIEKIVDYDKPLFHFHYRCSLYRFGEYLGECDAIANSRESKYNRKVLKCPKCGSNESIFKDKNSDKYYCWTKKGGCGARDLSQSSVNSGGQTFDYNTVNTLVKMCQKRALVGAVLIVCGVSQYFTQDLDDYR